MAHHVTDPFGVVLTLMNNANKLTKLERESLRHVYLRAERAAELERDVAKLEASGGQP